MAAFSLSVDNVFVDTWECDLMTATCNDGFSVTVTTTTQDVKYVVAQFSVGQQWTIVREQEDENETT
jgi:hypothetical protein